jgi:CopG family nickel-responsive transcriptional regulator
MTIISISLPDELLEELEKRIREQGFSGRSDVVRAGAKMLIADCKEKERLEGSLNSVLLVIHPQNVEDTVTEIKHEFEDIISTQIHNHLRKDTCLEIFILEGDADRVKELVRMLQTCGKMDLVKLIVA